MPMLAFFCISPVWVGEDDTSPVLQNANLTHPSIVMWQLWPRCQFSPVFLGSKFYILYTELSELCSTSAKCGHWQLWAPYMWSWHAPLASAMVWRCCRAPWAIGWKVLPPSFPPWSMTGSTANPKPSMAGSTTNPKPSMAGSTSSQPCQLLHPTHLRRKRLKRKRTGTKWALDGIVTVIHIE